MKRKQQHRDDRHPGRHERSERTERRAGHVGLVLVVLAVLAMAIVVGAEPRPGGPIAALGGGGGSGTEGSDRHGRSVQILRDHLESKARVKAAKGQRRPTAPPRTMGSDHPAPGPVQPTDILVVATVDGTLHGVHRATGETLWATQDPWGALAQVTEDPLGDLAHDVALGADPSDPEGRSPNSNSNSNSGGTAKAGLGAEGLIIPEPLGDGALYYKASNQQFKKWPLTIKDIVNHNAAITDDGFVYLPNKKTCLLSIDPLSGAILKRHCSDETRPHVASPGDPEVNPDALKGALMISRTEYMLMISDTKSNKIKIVSDGTLHSESSRRQRCPPFWISTAMDWDTRTSSFGNPKWKSLQP
ncbi:hypothetical protein BC830DRAFT_346826 [Chytriomyces sp. MP71]|nr:hypothetical protein BC830DRAFT_346826 [Chytriomyces sp. MP71]